MSHASDNIVIGKVGAAYGIKGWVKINSYTDSPDGIFSYSPWFIGDKEGYIVELWREQGKGLVAKIAGVNSRDDAEAIKNLDIAILAQQLPELGEDEFYWRDLTGLKVINLNGYDLGTVKEVFNTGANDILNVKANARDAFGKKERLIPFVYDSVIHSVDLAEKVIKVDWDPEF